MTLSVENATWGTLTYTESFWLGTKQLLINGKPLQKINKKTFSLNENGKTATFIIKGNYLSGVKLLVDGEEISLSQPAKLYEYVCSVIIFVFAMTWGNSATLCAIFPIVGGAIGGAISGVMGVLNLILMKSIKKWWLKILVWLGVFAATILILFAVALLIISALV